MCDPLGVYKKTTRQTSLMENALWLGGLAQARLKQSWAEGFCCKVLPVLLDAEDEFRGVYAAVGRPNWSVARLLGCMLLQELENKSDQQAVDSIVFDVRYQHALGLAGDEAYLTRRSLVGFRSRLANHGEAMALVRSLFDRICTTMCAELNLSTREQRTDSTWIISNIRVRGRLGLFRQTVRQFMMWLEHTAPSQLERLSPGLHAWHRDFDDGWEHPGEIAKHRPLILQLARWAYEIEQEFASDEAISSQEPYHLLERLLREQCIINKGDDLDADDVDGAQEKVEITVPGALRKGAGAMRTPHDPDATTGMKGVGYHVHVTETCNNDGRSEVITDFEVMPAHIPDIERTTDAIKRLSERELQPEILYADGGYPTPTGLAESEKLGTQLHAPVNRNKMPPTKMSRMDFKVDENDSKVLSCPRGHAPVMHSERAVTPGRRSPFALFDSAHCLPCPELENCPVQSPGKSHPNGSFRLEETRGLYLRDKSYIEQRSQSWRDKYKIRAGVEGTMSELKRAHGMGRLRVRRRPRVSLAVTFKLMACNIKRWLKCAWTAAESSQESAMQAA